LAKLAPPPKRSAPELAVVAPPPRRAEKNRRSWRGWHACVVRNRRCLGGLGGGSAMFAGSALKGGWPLWYASPDGLWEVRRACLGSRRARPCSGRGCSGWLRLCACTEPHTRTRTTQVPWTVLRAVTRDRLGPGRQHRLAAVHDGRRRRLSGPQLPRPMRSRQLSPTQRSAAGRTPRPGSIRCARLGEPLRFAGYMFSWDGLVEALPAS
jgi:hypothetical protein